MSPQVPGVDPGVDGPAGGRERRQLIGCPLTGLVPHLGDGPEAVDGGLPACDPQPHARQHLAVAVGDGDQGIWGRIRQGGSVQGSTGGS